MLGDVATRHLVGAASKKPTVGFVAALFPWRSAAPVVRSATTDVVYSPPAPERRGNNLKGFKEGQGQNLALALRFNSLKRECLKVPGSGISRFESDQETLGGVRRGVAPVAVCRAMRSATSDVV